MSKSKVQTSPLQIRICCGSGSTRLVTMLAFSDAVQRSQSQPINQPINKQTKANQQQKLISLLNKESKHKSNHLTNETNHPRNKQSTINKRGRNKSDQKIIVVLVRLLCSVSFFLISLLVFGSRLKKRSF